LQRIIARNKEAVTNRGGSFLKTHNDIYGADNFANYNEQAGRWGSMFDDISQRQEANSAARKQTQQPSQPSGGFKVLNVRRN
jgi:hypothetical protein